MLWLRKRLQSRMDLGSNAGSVLSGCLYSTLSSGPQFAICTRGIIDASSPWYAEVDRTQEVLSKQEPVLRLMFISSSSHTFPPRTQTFETPTGIRATTGASQVPVSEQPCSQEACTSLILCQKEMCGAEQRGQY